MERSWSFSLKLWAFQYLFGMELAWLLLFSSWLLLCHYLLDLSMRCFGTCQFQEENKVAAESLDTREDSLLKTLKIETWWRFSDSDTSCQLNLPFWLDFTISQLFFDVFNAWNLLDFKILQHFYSNTAKFWDSSRSQVREVSRFCHQSTNRG